MDRIQKLFSRLPKKERLQLQSFIDALMHDDLFKKTHIQKLKGGDLFRARKGRFRIIFHHDQIRDIVVDSIKVRNESTYRDL